MSPQQRKLFMTLTLDGPIEVKQPLYSLHCEPYHLFEHINCSFGRNQSGQNEFTSALLWLSRYVSVLAVVTPGGNCGQSHL